MNKKLISLITAAAMVMPMFTMLHTALADSATTPEVTVVGKRITGDDTYFEISLEVNGDYEDYSAVGVVLRYDPDYIVPAESWEDGAGELNLSGEGATTWGTRRALPTIGKDTWSTQTALAYEDYETDPASGSKKLYGYLYLGAEYPGTVPDDTNPSASPGAAAPAAAATTPSPTPNGTPDPDIYQNPVVAVRFMYKNTAAAGSDDAQVAASRLAQKTALVDKWLDTANSGANSWDGANWPNNEILTLASDTISGTSPAQYPYAYYRSNLEQYAYMKTWPVVPTADPAGTPLPLNMQLDIVKEIGADVDAAHQLTASNIEICLGEGKSAKATGGLSLNDIFVIMFFDWDDSLLGTLTSGVGVDATEAVNNYVEEKFIHPDLRSSAISPPYTTIAAAGVDTWKERQYSYRGEYPCEDPSTGATYPDVLDTDGNNTDPNAGSNFPVTNKLEYTLAGKDIDPEHPFANGWTKVEALTMSDVWTAMETGVTTCGRMPELDPNGSGYYLDSSGNPDPSIKAPDIALYDFSDVQSTDLDGGVLYVKAVYQDGTAINSNGTDNYYSVIGPEEYGVVGDVGTSGNIFSIGYELRRVSSSGYGVKRIRIPTINMSIKQVNATGYTSLPVALSNADIIPVELTPSQSVQEIQSYQLRDTATGNIITGAQRSDASGLGAFQLSGDTGFMRRALVNYIVQMADDINTGKKVVKSTDNWLTPNTLKAVPLYRTATGTQYTNATFAKQAQSKVLTFVAAAKTANGGVLPTNITRLQVQYALLNNGAYVDATTAENTYQSNTKLYGI